MDATHDQNTPSAEINNIDDEMSKIDDEIYKICDKRPELQRKIEKLKDQIFQAEKQEEEKLGRAHRTKYFVKMLGIVIVSSVLVLGAAVFLPQLITDNPTLVDNCKESIFGDGCLTWQVCEAQNTSYECVPAPGHCNHDSDCEEGQTCVGYHRCQ